MAVLEGFWRGRRPGGPMRMSIRLVGSSLVLAATILAFLGGAVISQTTTTTMPRSTSCAPTGAGGNMTTTTTVPTTTTTTTPFPPTLPPTGTTTTSPPPTTTTTTSAPYCPPGSTGDGSGNETGAPEGEGGSGIPGFTLGLGLVTFALATLVVALRRKG